MKRCRQPEGHMYDTVIKTKQVEFSRGSKAYTVFIAQAVLCSKCGDILFPDYPSNFSTKDLDSLFSLAERKQAKKEIEQLKLRRKK